MLKRGGGLQRHRPPVERLGLPIEDAIIRNLEALVGLREPGLHFRPELELVRMVSEQPAVDVMT